MKYNIDVLIRARQLKRWSKTELAAKIGLTENMVHKIETGSRTSEKTIFKMSEALGVPMERILPKQKVS